jgi:Predicted nucleotidyltransferases
MNRQELTRFSEDYIRSLLKKYLPENTPVYLFGSRARNDARWNSDYDLWVNADIDRLTLMRITNDIDESFVPFKVDIVQNSQIKGVFGECVKKEAKKWM